MSPRAASSTAKRSQKSSPAKTTKAHKAGKKTAASSNQLELPLHSGTKPGLSRAPGFKTPSKLLGELKRDATELANELKLNVDTDVYLAASRELDEPILFSGNLDSRIGFFGRDPGRDEVRLGKPLVGAAGRRVRAAVAENLLQELDFAKAPVSSDALIEVTERLVLFSNTVPFKQVGNKAWGEKITRRFEPIIASVLVDLWKGSHLITLGTEAFHWFGLTSDENQGKIDAFWGEPNRYEKSIALTVKSARTGASKEIHLYPLPHPSPLNVAWFKKFPDLLSKRFETIARF